LFLDKYFLPRRAAYSTIVFELNEAAVKAKIRPKESAYSTEPIEGSDSLTMMQISANFEGSYPDLIQFVNLIDKSQRLLIIEGLTATPQQGSGLLNVNLKLDAFVREDGSPL
jgi:Tfp pilus assembly protein PilO